MNNQIPVPQAKMLEQELRLDDLGDDAKCCPYISVLDPKILFLDPDQTLQVIPDPDMTLHFDYGISGTDTGWWSKWNFLKKSNLKKFLNLF